MGNNQSKQDDAIRDTRITESFEDNDYEFIDELFKDPSVPKEKILKLTNHDKRTPLHLVCKNGHLDLYYKLADQHQACNIGFDAVDEREDTPLALICSHGFERPVDKDQDGADYASELQEFIATKAAIITDLIARGASVRACCKKKKTTPLHWCVYYGNYEAGMAIFNAFPLIVLRKDIDGQTALEVLLHKSLKREFKPEAARLVLTIVQQFSSAFFDNDEAFIFKEANLNEIREFKALRAFKHQGSAFNALDLLKTIKKTSSENLYQKLMTMGGKKTPNNYIELVDKPDVENQVKEEKMSLLQSDESLEDNCDSAIVADDSNISVKIYDELTKGPLKNPYLKFLHKLMIIAVYVKDLAIVKLLLDNFNISPFVTSIDDLTAMHYACMKGRHQLVKFFLNLNYTYFNSKRPFDLAAQLNTLAGTEYNSCLHLAVKHGKINIYVDLMSKGANPSIFNYQDLRPLEMSRKPFFREKELELIEGAEYEDLVSFNDLAKPDSFNPGKVNMIRENFIYLIVARDVQADYTQSLVFQQLELLKTAWMDNIDIQCVQPAQNQVENYFRFFFLVNIKPELLDNMADYLNMEIYNVKRGYTVSFFKDSANEYIKFRDYHIHSIMLYLLNKEFNLDHYIKAGIIEQAFPLHEYKTRKNLQTNWKLERSTVFFDPWKMKSKPKDLRPFNSLAFYYGCDLGFYISFTTLYTSFLIILSAIGVSMYLWVLLSKQPLDNYLTPIFAFLISVWVTVTLEKWKQRENEHAFIWNTLNFKNNEIIRVDYKGNYVIDQVSKDLTVKDPFPTVKRRWMVN